MNEGKFQPITTGGDLFKVNFFKYLSKKLRLKVISTTRNYDQEAPRYQQYLASIGNSYEIELLPPYQFYSNLQYLESSIGDTPCVMFNDAINMNTIGRKLKQKLNVKIGYEAHNINYHLNTELQLGAKEITYEKIIETEALILADYIFVRSQNDKNQLQLLATAYSDKIHIARSGIDDQYIKNIYHLQTKSSFNKKIGFIGHLNYQPNIQAVQYIIDRIAPQVYQYDKEIVFLIAGVGMDKSRFKNIPNVQYVGYVPTVEAFLQDVDLAICPLTEGSGTRLKIVDYLSRGIPTISTSKGIEGLEDTIEECIILENNIDAYANKIKSFYNQDFASIQERSKKSLEFIKRYRAWSVIINDYYLPLKSLCPY
ncbi:glycosyltransferase family 4 protein [Candidatus Gracilibacteria bacterium]|nr:glycosyltransferase family 4 protein [Candidatus Gracilibacteria bacterium]